MAGKLYTFPNNFQAQKVQIAAAYSGNKLELPIFVAGETNKSAEFLKKFPLGKVPAFEGNGVNLFETNAIAYYVGNDQTRGGADESEVLQWIGVADNDVLPSACNWVYPVLGIMQYNKAATEKAKEDIKKVMNLINDHLQTRTFLVGERISQADITLACTLVMLYVNVFDADFRAPFGNVNRWFNTLINQSEFKRVLGEVKLCTKMGQFDAKKFNEISGKATKKEQTPKAKSKPKEQAKPKAEETPPPAEPAPKKVDPWADAPKPSFDMEAWKRFYSNHPEDEWFKYFVENFPKDDYSVWHCKYKYNDELKVDFMSLNLIQGMLQRIEKMRKHSFGVMLLLENSDKKPCFCIEGMWIWLGDKLAFERSENWQIDYEYFAWEKLDFNEQSTKDLIKQFWVGEGNIGDYEINACEEYK